MNPMTPVLLCGHPKSGTTLLVSLLDGHPDLLVFPEEMKFREVIARGNMEDKIAFLLNRSGARIPGLGEVNFPSGFRDYSSIDGEAYLRDLKRRFSEAGSDEALFCAVFDNWMEYTGRCAADRPLYMIEKTPGNEYLRDTFRAWFPGTRFIHIVRDPRDNFASYRRKQPGRHLLEFADDWRQSSRLALSRSDSEDYLVIKYEDLVAASRDVMSRVSEFLGIDFAESLLTPTRYGTTWSGNSMFGDNKGAIHKNACGRYREHLKAGEIRTLERYLCSEMAKLGYLDGSAAQPRSLASLRTKLALLRLARRVKSGARRLVRIPPRTP
jgi:hypothetical protein